MPTFVSRLAMGFMSDCKWREIEKSITVCYIPTNICIIFPTAIMWHISPAMIICFASLSYWGATRRYCAYAVKNIEVNFIFLARFSVSLRCQNSCDMKRLKWILFTILFPPLSVVGYGMKRIAIVLLLTLLGWLPGIVAAFIVQSGDIPEDTI